MKIAVSSTGQSIEDTVDERFGRCQYFLVIDPDSMEFEAVPNPNLSLGGGAGIQSAQLMSEKNVSVVLTGNCGPKAFQVFDAADIQVLTGISGNVRQAVQQFKTNALSKADVPNVESKFGMNRGMGGCKGMGRGQGGGQGMGMGRGQGGGQGMGMGRGGGMMNAPEFPSPSPTASTSMDQQELEYLKSQVENMEGQLKTLRRQIDEKEKKEL